MKKPSSLLSPPSSSSSSSIMGTLLMVLLEISISFLGGKSPATALPDNGVAPRPPRAVFAFGDSIVDTGNNNEIATLLKCNFPPYGRDFMGGKPTGRCSNGKVTSDFFADLFGVKESLPAYLDPNLKTEDLLTGVSFGSRATGYDPLTPKVTSAISLPEQLNLFKECVGKITAAVGEKQAAAIVAESVYIVVCGSDDIANNYFTLPFRRVTHDVNSYTDLMINNASSFYQGLYRLGARKIGVASAPPIGCVPALRRLDGGIHKECSESRNQMAVLFNKKLSAKIDDLNAQLPGSRLVYMDTYSIFFDIFRYPSNYGFEVGTEECCGMGNTAASIVCNPLSKLVNCENVTEYVFWDSFHPTQRTYEIVSKGTYDEYGSKLY